MSSPTDAPTHAPPTFASIVCGIDGSRPGFEAARQAAVLTEEGAALTYVTVSWEQGRGATATATITHDHARECLRRAREEAREFGVDPLAIDEHAVDPANSLMELAAAQDLLVLGIRGRSRVGGIMIGGTATAAVHRSPVPVLVARRPPDGSDFPKRIVVASDGTPTSDAAVDLTARLAARHAASVAIVTARVGDVPFRPGLAEHATRIKEATGTEPVVIDEPGPAHRAIATGARDFGASLVVTGSRGLAGAAALGSVSERVAHGAPCSVLVVRP